MKVSRMTAAINRTSFAVSTEIYELARMYPAEQREVLEEMADHIQKEIVKVGTSVLAQAQSKRV